MKIVVVGGTGLIGSRLVAVIGAVIAPTRFDDWLAR